MAKGAEVQKKFDPMTAVKRCRCPHVYQDKRYGKHMRVHNRTKQADAKQNQGWRCTICGTVK